MAQIIEIGKKTKKVPAKLFVEHRYCSCGGEMLLKQPKPGEPPIMLATWPPKFPHVCNLCGKIDHFEEQYPRTIIEEDEIDVLKPVLD